MLSTVTPLWATGTSSRMERRRRPTRAPCDGIVRFAAGGCYDRAMKLHFVACVPVSVALLACASTGSGTSGAFTEAGGADASDDDGGSGGEGHADGSVAAGGDSSNGGVDGTVESGGPDGGGGTDGAVGESGADGAADTGPGSYALPPPNACSNVFATQDCTKGDPSSACGGICANSYGATSANVCSGGASGVPVNYECVRDMLYGDEMSQAAIDDGYGGQFNYGIVGHDPDSTGIDTGVDGGAYASCCQCYQREFDYPKENQAWVNPNGSGAPQSSAVTVPMPLVVQSANTATNGPDDFDIFMGAGGFGANNGCYVSGGACPGGPCMYTAWETVDPSGSVKAAGNTFSNPSPDACKNTNQWVTEATLTSSGCATDTVTACDQITSANATIQAETQRSCIQSNGVEPNDAGAIPADYHLNWYVWVKRVECPSHLTEVTGCKLASQGLPAPDPTVQTPAQAQAAGFAQNAGTGTPFNTTQMQDCCMPSCAWSNNVPNATTGGYDSLYSCDSEGNPWTTAVTRTP